MKIPSKYEPYTDIYFLRLAEILKKENLNPFVRVQLFIRKGPGTIAGTTEAISLLNHFSDILKNSGSIYALQEGAQYDSEETVMVIEGKALDVLPFETIILGVISAQTTIANDGRNLDTKSITDQVQSIVSLVDNRPVSYFGARHWRYDKDAEITKAAFAGGASEASTGIGAATVGKKGVGTIPHSLECIYAWKYGYDAAVLESTKAFDRHIDQNVPRIALVDFANKEIDDSLAVAKALGTKLFGIRIDTCGENCMQGEKITKEHAVDTYRHGTGVTISGVVAVRKALNENGFEHIKIMLSSGFGDTQKVQAFVNAEKELSLRLFDGLGVGNVFHSRATTMDVVAVGEERNALIPIAKVGRTYKPNPRLKKIFSHS